MLITDELISTNTLDYIDFSYIAACILHVCNRKKAPCGDYKFL